MIKLTSFYPFNKFMRITQEFGKEKIIVTVKSLATEHQFDVKYDEISKIQYRLFSNRSEVAFGIFTALITGLIFTNLYIYQVKLLENTVFLLLGRATYIIGILAIVFGAIKKERCGLFDKNDGFITSIRVDAKNKEDVDKAISLVRSKSNIKNETDPDNPFPEGKYLFEYITYDIPDYLSKSTARFYEEELIDYEKSFANELVTKVRYDELGEQIIRGKQGNSSWTNLGFLLIFLGGILFSFMYLFKFTSYIPQTEFRILLYASGALGVAGILAFFMGLVKEEFLFFYDRNKRLAYIMKVPNANKQKAQQILEFIQSKIEHPQSKKTKRRQSSTRKRNK